MATRVTTGPAPRWPTTGDQAAQGAGGRPLVNELFAEDWALRRFAGVSNLAAAPQNVSAADMALFEGRYVAQQVVQNGHLATTVIDLHAGSGQLNGTMSAADNTSDPEAEDTSTQLGLMFYRPDYGLDLGPDGKPVGTRSNFVRGPDGTIAWFRTHGRLYRRQ
jgi:hypothetical protein